MENKDKESLFKCSDGFSIVEIIVAAGMLGIISFGVMKVTQNMSKATKADTQKFELSQLLGQVNSILRDEYSCEASLNGLDPNGAGDSLTELKRRKKDGTETIALKVGQVLGSAAGPIFLKAMTIKNFDSGTQQSDFILTINKGRKDYDTMTPKEQETIKKTSFGTPVIHRVLKVNTIVDASGKIKDCVSDKDDYTSGACAILSGNWDDKVKCKSIEIDTDGSKPAITALNYMAVKQGLIVGSTLPSDPTGNPGDGNLRIANNLEVQGEGSIRNDLTLENGNLKFSNQDVRIAQTGLNTLNIETGSGASNANLIIGSNTDKRTTLTSNSIAVNRSSGADVNIALDVEGNVNIRGNNVTVTIGGATINYDGRDLILRNTGGKVIYRDGSSDEEDATRGWVNSQIAKVLTGDPTTLNNIVSQVLGSASSSGLDALRRDFCNSLQHHTWSGGKCNFTRSDNCGTYDVMGGYSSGNKNCKRIVYPSQACSSGNLLTGFNSGGTKQCSDFGSTIGGYVDGKVDGLRKELEFCGNGVYVSGSTRICRVPGSSCPPGTSKVSNWTTTVNVKCQGGSTTGCNSGKSCNTGSHGFSNKSQESCYAKRHAACGPATSGGKTCYSTITEVGCTMP